MTPSPSARWRTLIDMTWSDGASLAAGSVVSDVPPNALPKEVRVAFDRRCKMTVEQGGLAGNWVVALVSGRHRFMHCPTEVQLHLQRSILPRRGIPHD
ncbi:MAG: hypothetical protein KGS10_05675 [Chloroflexi bacterium]|nr:hypothetical protein [Chloroflexota bacterium]